MTTVAAIAAQPTPLAQEIHRLHLHERRLYLPHGDYGANTGPTHVLSLNLDDLAAPVLDELTCHTEEIYNYATLNDGRLAVPYIDPQGYGDPTQGVAALRGSEGAWTVITTITDHEPIHVTAITRRTDGTLVICGSSQEFPSGESAAWLSTDDGATWTKEAISTGPTEFERAYAVTEIDGVLHAWVSNGGQASAGEYERNDLDGTWAKTSALSIQELHPATTLGVEYFWSHEIGPSTGMAEPATIAPYPPALPSPLAEAVADWPRLAVCLTVDTDGTVWWLGASHDLHRGGTDGVHTALGVLDDPTIASLAVDVTGGFLYFGTTDSRVLSLPIP